MKIKILMSILGLIISSFGVCIGIIISDKILIGFMIITFLINVYNLTGNVNKL